MPRQRNKFSPEEKAAYFANIRKNDPKRLCNHCNRFATIWEGEKQTCQWHREGPATPHKPAREIIDELTYLLNETVFPLSKDATNRLLVMKIMAKLKEVRPDGVKNPSERKDLPSKAANK